MSALKIAQALENCKVGPSIRRGVSNWLQKLLRAQQRTPLLLSGASEFEVHQLAKELHKATQKLFNLEGKWISVHADELYKHLQTYGHQPLQSCVDGTLFLHGIGELRVKQQLQLLEMLNASTAMQRSNVLFLLAWEDVPSHPTIYQELELLFPNQLVIPPLHSRDTDIDRLICRLFQHLLEEHQLHDIEGFSLEAIAHIHRAILQTQQNGHALHDFLTHVLEHIQAERLPLHEKYIVAWPTVRLLEESWGYRINKQDELLQEAADYDFQERLFFASMEHASCRSGFSKEVIELQCQLLQRMLTELPPHQRNYQGLTSRVDRLQWIGMKLLSHARTQAELRDFFGFGGEGKIPKATAKLKFDQYDLEHFGYRSTDPLPWQVHTRTKPTYKRFHVKPANSDTPQTLWPIRSQSKEEDGTPTVQDPPTEPRHIVQVQGELEETLFWRHQDLFTVLAADALSVKQVAQLMNVSQKKARIDLNELVQHGFLKCTAGRYAVSGDDIYYRHRHVRLHALEENVFRYLNSAFENKETSILENWFLRLPPEGLPALRETLLHPFVHEHFLPLSDHADIPSEQDEYNKEMYTLSLFGTHRLSSQIHGRLPLEQRIVYYFREASLQRADRQQRHQAICLRAAQMLAPSRYTEATRQVHTLRKQLKEYLPHGRGNKPNFNLTLCLTKVPLAFYRDTQPIANEFHPFSF